MRSKRNFNAVIAIILIIILSIVSVYNIKKADIFSLGSLVCYICIVLSSVFVQVILINLEYQRKYIDRLTEINNDTWIIRKGTILYKRNKLNGFDCLFFNIKDSKYINQKITNINGDVVISVFANRVKSFLRKKGYVGRMGGDNFLAFIKDEYLDEFLAFIKNQVIEVEYNEKKVVLNVGARVGICKIQNMNSKQEGENGSRNIINRASLALKRAKEEYIDYYIFEREMMDNFVRDTEILKDARKGMENNEFVPYYQPKVDARTGKLCGAEGLVRWKKDDQIISPGYFISVLERNGEIADLDYLIFELVCADIKSWEASGIEPVKISTNFSKLHLKEDDFSERIIEIKNRYAVDSKYIEIELTESTEGKNLLALREFSKKLKKENITIAIDDFGTGYSSLSLIKNFDADVIKLDKSFLDSAKAGDIISKNFVRDIISMIENLGEITLCEGVEDKEQLDFLVDAGCNIIQGFYFDKPMPKEEFEKRLLSPIYQM